MEHTPSNAPANPLQEKLTELGYPEYARWCKREIAAGRLRDLTAEADAEFKFSALSAELNRIPEEELVKVAVPKRDKDGKVLMSDGYVQHEDRMVYKREHERKRLLKQSGITEAQLAAWEKARAAQH